MTIEQFPAGFFGRADEFDDAVVYEPVRLVTHIDAAAIAGVASLYDELGINGRVLDLMSSWVSHFSSSPSELAVLGMNPKELGANPMATSIHTHDLNASPVLPFADDHFTDVVCAMSVDYLTKPVEVFAEVCRVLEPGGRFVCTFSNRCFPTKAIRGWLTATEPQRCELVEAYFRLAGGFSPAVIDNRTAAPIGDPLYAVWAAKR